MVPFVITNIPKSLEAGDLTKQGLCFFAGSIKLSQRLQIHKTDNSRFLIHLKKPCAILSKVYINDMLAKVLPWAPYDVDISDFVKEGDNKITVQLFAGNRNLLGPHHYIQGESYSVSPLTFTDKPGWGDGGWITDVWRDRYCFVEFGIKE